MRPLAIMLTDLPSTIVFLSINMNNTPTISSHTQQNTKTQTDLHIATIHYRQTKVCMEVTITTTITIICITVTHTHTYYTLNVWLAHISSQPHNNSTLATHVHKNFIGFWCELGCKAIQRTRYYRSCSLQYQITKSLFHGNTAGTRTR